VSLAAWLAVLASVTLVSLLFLSRPQIHSWKLEGRGLDEQMAIFAGVWQIKNPQSPNKDWVMKTSRMASVEP